jgi:BMFP domain-containing protein YqiC
MQSQNKFFDDLAKVLNGAAGTVAGMAREGADGARERAREWMGGLDFVSREEFETVRDMLTAARAEIDALKARLDTMDGGTGPAPKARKPKG